MNRKDLIKKLSQNGWYYNVTAETTKYGRTGKSLNLSHDIMRYPNSSQNL